MDQDNFTNLQQNSQKQISFLKKIIFVLLIIVVFQFGFIVWQKANEKVIIVPPRLTAGFWVSRYAVDQDYLTEMSRYYIKEILNITPKSVDYTINQLLKISSPKKYGQIKSDLNKLRDRVQKEQIAISFFPHHITINRDQLTAAIQGELMIMLSQHTLVSRNTTYEIDFEYMNGRLLLAGFSEKEGEVE